KGGKPKDGNDMGDLEKANAFKAAMATRVNEAKVLDVKITALANRINNEVNFTAHVVPAGVSAEAQSVYAQALTLVAGAAALDPTPELAAVQSQFKSLVEYLKVRADALQKGLRAVTSGGDYKAEFDRGGAAKSSFDAAWPGFLNTCRGAGISV
ncbi:MAG: hypothetical protein ACYC99_02420, partial [Candidatus Geothermincolia bacterium]